MSKGKGLRYDKMVESALRGVVREALRQVADHGFPDSHHFYITFRTVYPGVQLPIRLRERYPDELTIVLQHQFWGLEVTERGFDVTLSFDRVNERLHIPLAAITGFADPSVKFGLQFQISEEDAEAAKPVKSIAAPSQDDDELADKAPPFGRHADKAGVADEADSDADDKSDAVKPTGQVITLDAFRKK